MVWRESEAAHGGPSHPRRPGALGFTQDATTVLRIVSYRIMVEIALGPEGGVSVPTVSVFLRTFFKI